jgi:hypothetical protein
MTISSLKAKTFLGHGFAVLALLGVACGGGTQTPARTADASIVVLGSDAGQPVGPLDSGMPATGLDAGLPPPPSDAGMMHPSVYAMSPSSCDLPHVPADTCAALPTGKIAPCTQDGGQPSQNGYFEIDQPGLAPIYVCATSWNPDPGIGYIFGQPGTFMSDPQSCCGGAATPVAVPSVPALSIGSPGAPHIPSHVKPPEIEQLSMGPLRHNPFAITVTDAATGATVGAAMSTWHSWAGDGQPHTAPDGTGPYYFPLGLPVNYVITESPNGVPVIVVGPEVSLTPDGNNPLGHPTLGSCAAGGGAPLALMAGEVDGTTLNNRSGRYDYGPGATAQSLNVAAQLFNCMGIQITATKYYAPKS